MLHLSWTGAQANAHSGKSDLQMHKSESCNPLETMNCTLNIFLFFPLTQDSPQ